MSGIQTKKELEEKVKEEIKKKKATNPNMADLYLRIYNDAFKHNFDIDHKIVQQGCEYGAEVASSVDVVHGAKPSEKIIPPSLSIQGDASVKRLTEETQQRHKHFYQKLVDRESLIQMQEERKKEAEEEIRLREQTTEEKKLKAKQFLEKGLAVRQETLRTKDIVQAYQVYKEYVQKSVPLWGKEADNVDGVCGRFRDLLTLRFQLLCRVEDGFLKLHNAKFKQQQLIDNEKIQEGKELLDVYRHRESLWAKIRESEEAEARLRTLREESTTLATNLTRVHLALSNMYSVARRFQEVLPVLQPDTLPEVVLQRLHNFIIDATQVLKIATSEDDSDSVKPNKGSI